MAALPTYLAPGQRYGRPDRPDWRADHQLTIVHIDHNAHGLAWVTYRGPGGQDLVEPAAWFEAAIAAGEIVPVAGGGPIARC